MKYNAFFGELPINAFKPIGGRMTLEGGGNPISAVTDAVSNVVGGAVNTVEDLGAGIDRTVRDVVPGGWTGAALLAAGAYYAPEIGAWIDQSGAVVPGSAGVAPEAAANIAPEIAALPAGSAYVAPEVTTLGNVAGTTEGMASGTSAADMAAGYTGGGISATPGAGLDLAATTGAPSLAAGTGTSLAEMGGAQGLSTLGAAGGVLGAEGLTSGLSNAGTAGIGAGLGLGSAAAANNAGAALTSAGIGAGTGAAAAGAGTLTGSALGDMAAINAGSGLLGGYLSSTASKEAAQIQADAAAKALAQQQANFNTINAQQAPYRASGYGALNQLANLGSGSTTQYDANGNPIGNTTGASDYLTHQFNAADLKAGLAPNYDFMLQQGQMANQRAANASGGALGGNALQGLNTYTQNYAGNAYQNAFTNYQNQRSNIYNTLAGIAGIGQTGQSATNAAATNATNAASQLGVGSAAAQASGTVGSANAYTNAINNATGNYTLASLLNQRGTVQAPV